MSDILQNIVKWKFEVFIDLYVKPNFARKSLKSPLDLFKKTKHNILKNWQQVQVTSIKVYKT